MIAITIRANHTLYTDFSNYAQFPFDTLYFTFRFEISHFSLKFKDKKIEYRFDFYEQSNSSIECKQKLGYLPELILDHQNIQLFELKEKKPY